MGAIASDQMVSKISCLLASFRISWRRPGNMCPRTSAKPAFFIFSTAFRKPFSSGAQGSSAPEKKRTGSSGLPRVGESP